MALIVEDGTLVAGAEAYASIAWVADWLDKRGLLAEWNGLVTSLAEKEADAREATDYLRGYTWPGRLVAATQALDWPRAGLTIASTVVPERLMAAQALLMYERRKGGPLLPSWSGAPVRRKSAGGGVEKEFAGPGEHPVRHFPQVSTMLSGLYVHGPGAGRAQLVRA